MTLLVAISNPEEAGRLAGALRALAHDHTILVMESTAHGFHLLRHTPVNAAFINVGGDTQWFLGQARKIRPETLRIVAGASVAVDKATLGCGLAWRQLLLPGADEHVLAVLGEISGTLPRRQLAL